MCRQCQQCGISSVMLRLLLLSVSGIKMTIMVCFVFFHTEKTEVTTDFSIRRMLTNLISGTNFTLIRSLFVPSCLLYWYAGAHSKSVYLCETSCSLSFLKLLLLKTKSSGGPLLTLLLHIKSNKAGRLQRKAATGNGRIHAIR